MKRLCFVILTFATAIASLPQVGTAADKKKQREASSDVPPLGFSLEERPGRRISIVSVDQASLAANAGFRSGDQILFADGRRFISPDKLLNYLKAQRKRVIPIVIRRDGETLTINWTGDAKTALKAGAEELGRQEKSDVERPERPRFGRPADPLDRQTAHSERSAIGLVLRRGGEGMIVERVLKDSPAEEAGIQHGDRIISLEGAELENAAAFRIAVREAPVGRELKIGVERDGKKTEMTVRPSHFEAVYANELSLRLADEEMPKDLREFRERMRKMMTQGRGGAFRMMREFREMQNQLERLEARQDELQQRLDRLEGKRNRSDRD